MTKRLYFFGFKVGGCRRGSVKGEADVAMSKLGLAHLVLY